MEMKRYTEICPKCKGIIKVREFEKEDGEVVTIRLKCSTCRSIQAKQKQRQREEERKNKCLCRIEKSIAFLKKHYDIKDYEPAIVSIKEKAGKPGWFQSINEILVALELTRLKIKAKHQASVCNYRVDFLLVDFKVILEVDSLFHNKEKDQKRDEFIKSKIGTEWEIIRVDGELLKKNLRRLVPGIKSVLTRRRKDKQQAV